MAETSDEEQRVISNSVIFDCEWRKRPINLMQVLKSFVSQLSLGDELTKISLPAEICHPFSMLEMISFRELSFFHLLFDINKHPPEDHEARFLAVLKWLTALLQAEEMEKKPYNPVIGEQHICWVEHSEDNWTEFISEQVSHHPPVSSFFVRNKNSNVEMHGNLKFNVRFGGNYAAVTTAGAVIINSGQETFTLDKSIPNMIIQNIVWGVKYVMWNGDITLSCEKSGYSATLSLSEVSPTHNKVEGKVFKNDQHVYDIFGQCGVLVELFPVSEDDQNSSGSSDGTQGIPLFVADEVTVNTISYPPVSAQIEMDSLRLWKKASDAIVKNDIPLADFEKQKVENSQRARERARKEAGLPYIAKYFENQDSTDHESAHWNFKHEVEIGPQFILGLKEQVIQENQERETKLSLAAQEAEQQPPPPEGEGCLLQ
eukprot:TRINITY_DN4146_c0_g1_i3.p1 TRINITY_DN4146_c0_g1~~TRINITY_DN4146_c0_g1_i3.p1  ORF type:complete len:429 (-),score=95.12 TRINITY_DN4146_c0_g1_i3:423-1709(-)